MINNHFIIFILREVFPDKFKCMSLDNLDFLAMFYLEHKDTMLMTPSVAADQNSIEVLQYL